MTRFNDLRGIIHIPTVRDHSMQHLNQPGCISRNTHQIESQTSRSWAEKCVAGDVPVPALYNLCTCTKENSTPLSPMSLQSVRIFKREVHLLKIHQPFSPEKGVAANVDRSNWLRTTALVRIRWSVSNGLTQTFHVRRKLSRWPWPAPLEHQYSNLCATRRPTEHTVCGYGVGRQASTLAAPAQLRVNLCARPSGWRPGQGGGERPRDWPYLGEWVDRRRIVPFLHTDEWGRIAGQRSMGGRGWGRPSWALLFFSFGELVRSRGRKKNLRTVIFHLGVAADVI
jgi:hypothetical protein